jgi:cupin fold WbuC family metalloprotein
MRNLYSKIDPSLLLHIVNKQSDITEKRVDMTPNEEFLQVACFKLNKGRTFKPHKHIENIRTTNMTQESWIVIRGKIKAILYDIDNTILEEVVLEAGDCSITLRGGHNYLSLEDDSAVYEYKTGPYFGVDKDKVFI